MTRRVESVLIFSLYCFPILFPLFFISFILCRPNFFFSLHFHFIIQVIFFTSSNNAWFSFVVSCSRFSPSILPALHSFHKHSCMCRYRWKYGRIQEDWVLFGVIKCWLVYIYTNVSENHFIPFYAWRWKWHLPLKRRLLVEINLKVLKYHTILNFFGFAIQILNIRKGIQLENISQHLCKKGTHQQITGTLCISV